MFHAQPTHSPKLLKRTDLKTFQISVNPSYKLREEKKDILFAVLRSINWSCTGLTFNNFLPQIIQLCVKINCVRKVQLFTHWTLEASCGITVVQWELEDKAQIMSEEQTDQQALLQVLRHQLSQIILEAVPTYKGD